MSTKRIYNRVMQANNTCPLGELLTDKELEKLKLNNGRYPKWLFTMKVRVNVSDIYFSFGVRFAHDYELLAEKYSTEELERILGSIWGKALDSRDYGICLGVIAARKTLLMVQPGDCVDWYGRTATVIGASEDGETVVLDVCGEEVFTDIDELISLQL